MPTSHDSYVLQFIAGLDDEEVEDDSEIEDDEDDDEDDDEEEEEVPRASKRKQSYDVSQQTPQPRAPKFTLPTARQGFSQVLQAR